MIEQEQLRICLAASVNTDLSDLFVMKAKQAAGQPACTNVISLYRLVIIDIWAIAA